MALALMEGGVGASVEHAPSPRSIAADDAAAHAGAQFGDLITDFDRVDIHNPDQLAQRVVLQLAGRPGVVVADRQVTFTVTIGRAPAQ
jgi:hypothetical protein